jgi:pSer/pThr/pTyr-binding forkhead associated (FHA) protein
MRRQSSLVAELLVSPLPSESATIAPQPPRMALNTISSPTHSSGSGVFPALIFVQGSEQKNIVLNRTPFTVGRKVDKDLVIADPRVSRDHAQIMQDGHDFFIEDLGSKHGTFVNGERIQRQKLERGYRLEFGARD